MPFIMLLAVSA